MKFPENQWSLHMMGIVIDSVDRIGRIKDFVGAQDVVDIVDWDAPFTGVPA